MEGEGGDERTGQTLVEAALEILNTADPVEKARLGEAAATRWLQGTVSLPYRDHGDLPVPDRPARLSNVKLVAPHLMPKLGKGGSLQSRQAILHSLVHTESWAIDLSWESMPREFFSDFVRVARDEGRHFTLLAARLQEMGSFYGAFSAHDGLWDSAIETSQNLLARLAVEHCVHEARGLDVLPTIITRFQKGEDKHTADLLETVVYPEEITHCAAGIKWFRYLILRSLGGHQSATLLPGCAAKQQLEDGQSIKCLERSFRSLEIIGSVECDAVIQTFHSTVRKYFRGPLKPPFNERARTAAGFGPEWYEPLAVKEVKMPK
ncbi:hypothetical protein COCNU_scaffold006300G000010 [Cocos nucifera]|nr:hypothetical protein [Cocos nucifera]